MSEPKQRSLEDLLKENKTYDKCKERIQDWLQGEGYLLNRKFKYVGERKYGNPKFEMHTDKKFIILVRKDRFVITCDIEGEPFFDSCWYAELKKHPRKKHGNKGKHGSVDNCEECSDEECSLEEDGDEEYDGGEYYSEEYYSEEYDGEESRDE